MKSDHALADLFARDPDLIKLLSPSACGNHYHMKSEVIKEVEKRIDAVFYPDKETLPIVHCEFQGYDDAAIYYRALCGLGLLGERNLTREINVLIVFLRESYDPKTEPWHTLGRSSFSGFEVVYLSEVVARLRAEEPLHPVTGLLNLLVEPQIGRLKEQIRRDFENIQNAKLPKRLRANYGKIFIYWLMQRLGERFNHEEVLNMLDILTPLEDTLAYKTFEKAIAGKYEKKLRLIRKTQEMTQKLQEQTREEQEQTRIEREQTRIEREQTRIEQEQTRIEQEQTRIEREQTRIEREQNRVEREQIDRAKEKMQQARAFAQKEAELAHLEKESARKETKLAQLEKELARKETELALITWINLGQSRLNALESDKTHGRISEQEYRAQRTEVEAEISNNRSRLQNIRKGD